MFKSNIFIDYVVSGNVDNCEVIWKKSNRVGFLYYFLYLKGNFGCFWEGNWKISDGAGDRDIRFRSSFVVVV